METYSRLCRLCFGTGEVDLFKPGDGDSINAKQLKELLQIELQDIPGWPLTACSGCVQQLKDIRDFRAIIVASQKKLLQLVSDIQIKCEPIDESCFGYVQIDAEEVPEDIDHLRNNSGIGDFEEFPETAIKEEELCIADSELVLTDEYDSSEENLTSDEESEENVDTSTKSETQSTTLYRRSTDIDSNIEKMLRDFNVLKCEPCKATFTSTTAMNGHAKTAHKQTCGFITCCKVKYYGRTKAYDHMRYHLDRDTFKCSECGKSCMSTRQLKMHKQAVHDEMENKCKECDREFRSAEALQLHLKKAHLDPEKLRFKCSHCEKGFYFRCDLKVHMKNHSKPTECQVCGKMVVQMNAHLRSQHPPPNKWQSCRVCGMKMPAQKLKYHESTVHAKQTFPCSTCGKVYKSKWTLQRHGKLEHS